VSNGATLEFGNSVASGATINLAGSGTIKFADLPGFAGSLNNFAPGDTFDLTNFTYENGETLTWTQNGSSGTLAINNGVQPTEDIVLAGTYTQSDFVLTPDSSGANAGTDVVFNSPDYWGSTTFPSQPSSETHLSGGDLQLDAFAGFGAVLYASIPNYNPSGDPGGPYSVTRNLLPLDPFLLPTLSGSQVTVASTQLSLPAKSQLILPNIMTSPTSVAPEGIVTYVTQPNGPSGSYAIDQIIAAPGQNGVSFSSPTTIENSSAAGSTIYNMDMSFRTDSTTTTNIPYLSTYSLAWDQYNSVSNNYAVDFQIFNGPNGSTSSSGVETPVSITTFNGQSVSATNLPAWLFRNDGGIYALGIAEQSSNGKDFIQFTGYFPNGIENGAAVTGSISNTTLTVSAISSGTIAIGDTVQGTGVAANTTILSQLSGPAGGIGTYQLSSSQGTVVSEGMSIAVNTADLSAFTISPNLRAYSGSPTNEITQDVIPSLSPSPGSPSHQLEFGQVSGTNANDWVIGWNETITGSTSASTDQVEFVIDKPNTGLINISSLGSLTGSIAGTTLTVSAVSSGTVVPGETITGTGIAANTTITSQLSGTPGGIGTYQLSSSQGTVTSEALSLSSSYYTAQLQDAQAVRIQTYTSGSNDFVVLAYGDATATHLVEFQISNIGGTASEIASIVVPTTEPLTELLSLGDGRFALEYDNVVGPGQTSQYTYQIFDFRTAALNVNDSGLNDGQAKYIAGTQFTSSGPGTGDQFTGENNVNNTYYYVGLNTTTNPSGVIPTDTFHGGTTANGGSSWNVAILPDALSNYQIATSAGITTLVNNVDADHRGTLVVNSNVQELAITPNVDPSGSNSVSVSGGITTLNLPNPALLTGNIILYANGDVLDLGGFNAQPGDHFSATAIHTGSVTQLTVVDLVNQNSATITLLGDYAADNNIYWTATYDGHGGANIVDPPLAPAGTISNAASLDISTQSNETVSFAGATGSLVLEQPESFTGQIVGFAGTAPDAAHSDTVDLVGINYDSSKFAESFNSSTGLLTVTDGVNTASFTFDNFNGTLAFSSDGNGGTLITDPPTAASTQTDTAVATTTISSGTTVDIAHASSAPVTFQGSTGTLELDHSASFTGTISGFGGDGTLAGSDHIDLKDVSYSSLEKPSFANGVLTVSDGTDTANLDFNGSYQLANFKLAPDGHGGTIVYDPPVPDPSTPADDDANTQSGSPDSFQFKATLPQNGMAGANASTPPGTASSQDAGSLTGDSFVFSSNFGSDAFTQLQPATDLTAANQAVADQTQHVLDALHDVTGAGAIGSGLIDHTALESLIKDHLQHASSVHLG
jgi:hypothetical protein